MKGSEFLKTTISYGLATMEVVGQSVRDSVLFSVDGLLPAEEEPLYNASFGELSEVASLTGRGFCIDGKNFLLKDDGKNLAAFGNTGSGKSSAIACPNILAASGQSYVIHDSSGGLLAQTGNFLESINYNVFVWDFLDVDHSCGINPLDAVTDSTSANKLATHLVRASLGTNAPDKFWENSATSLLRLLIQVLKKQPRDYQTLGNLRRLVIALTGNVNAVDELMVKWDELFLEYFALRKSSDKTFSSIVLSALSCLGLWADENICRVTAKTTIDFSKFRKDGRCALFLKNSTWDAAYYRPLLSILVNDAIKVFMERLPEKGVDKSVWFILDESSTLNLDSLDLILSNNRKYNISFLLFYQNVAQVFHSLGEQAGNNLLANCNTKLYIEADMRTAHDLEDLMGKTTVTKDGKDIVVPLMQASHIRLMPTREALLIIGNQKPYKVTLTPFFKNPYLRLRVGSSYQAPKGSLPLHIPLIPLSAPNAKK